jgi:hypothetical protein
MRVQAGLDPAATRLNACAVSLEVNGAFLGNDFGLQHRRLARLRKVFEVRVHALFDCPTAGSEFTAVSFDIGRTCLHRCAGLRCGDRPE